MLTISRPLAALAVVATAALLSSCGSSTAETLPVADGQAAKVLVLTAFAPETAPWRAAMPDARTLSVAGTDDQLFCDSRAVCVLETGMGETNAAAAVTAVLASDELDLSDAVIVRAGIAGAPIDTEVTLGSAIWADWVVSWDLGHHLYPETEDSPLFVPLGDGYPTTFALNERLLDLAVAATQDMTLQDSAEAVQGRNLYPQQVGKKPTVGVGANVSGDDFWVGAELAEVAQDIVEHHTEGQAFFATSAMEDQGDATALARWDMLDHYASLRTVSNYVQPPAGMTSEEKIAQEKFHGGPIAFANAYAVTAQFIAFVLDNPGAVRAALAD